MRSTMRNSIRCLTAVFLFGLLPAWAGAQERTVGGKNLDHWIKEAGNSDPAVQENAIRMILEFGEDAKKALPTLVKLLNDPDMGVQAGAVMALRAIGTEKDLKDIKDAVPALTNLLQKGGISARVQAALILAHLGPEAKSAVKTLSEQTLKYDRSWELRKAGALALGRTAYDKNGADPAVLRALTNALGKDDCAQVRLQCLLSLGMLDAHKSPTGLSIVKNPIDLAARNDKDPAVLIWAHVLQAQMEGANPETHLSYFSKQLKHTDPQIRGHAAQALGVLGALAKPKIPDLIEVLKDDDFAVAHTACASLGHLKEHVADKDLAAIAKLFTAKEMQTRCQAMQTLGLLGAKAHVSDLIAVLEGKEKDPAEMMYAMEALARIGKDAEKAVPVLTKLKEHKDEEVKRAAEEALAQITAAKSKK